MRKLSKAALKKDRYAWCPNCGEGFIDDLPIGGSIRCPNKNCRIFRWCVERGLSLSELREKQEGLPYAAFKPARDHSRKLLQQKGSKLRPEVLCKYPERPMSYIECLELNTELTALIAKDDLY